MTQYKHITQDAAKQIIDSNEKFQIVDVRSEDEFESGHIPGAVCIPNETIGLGVKSILKDPEETLLVYCRSGVRSVMAAEKFCMMGYKNVLEFGGILDWAYEIEK